MDGSVTRLEELTSQGVEELTGRRTDFLAMGMERAYCGAPAEASADEGEKTLDTLAQMLVELAREAA